MKIVAEIGLSHDGSLGYAFGLVEALADVGVDAVKFQCHTGDPCTHFRPGTSFPQDRTRQDYWLRTEFSRGEWAKLITHVRDNELECGVSVFSLRAVKLLEGRVDFWKIGSAQTNNVKLLAAVNGTADIVLSTGMSDYIEIDTAMRLLSGSRVTLLQCTTKYPTEPSDVGLNVMQEFAAKYPCAIGLSDHSGTIWPGIVAASMGADMLEVHATWDKRQWGPDVSSSLTVDEIAQLVDGVRYVERMRPVEKNAVAVGDMREVFR